MIYIVQHMAAGQWFNVPRGVTHDLAEARATCRAFGSASRIVVKHEGKLLIVPKEQSSC